MAIPVIFSNSTAGTVEAYRLDDLINQGKIVAYKNCGDWVRVGPKSENEEQDAAGRPMQEAVYCANNEPCLYHSGEKKTGEDKGMMIGVIYKNNRRGMIDEYRLDELIKEDKINAFRRSGGWVRIGHDPVREKWRQSGYTGPERRKRELPPDYFL